MREVRLRTKLNSKFASIYSNIRKSRSWGTLASEMGSRMKPNIKRKQTYKTIPIREHKVKTKRNEEIAPNILFLYAPSISSLYRAEVSVSYYASVCACNFIFSEFIFLRKRRPTYASWKTTRETFQQRVKNLSLALCEKQEKERRKRRRYRLKKRAEHELMKLKISRI